jgi:hypothetical protein
VHNCNLINSGDFDFLASACNDPSNMIDAEDNYWVATDSITIADMHVYDHDDDSGSPTVDFVPFLIEAAVGSIGGIVYDEDLNPIADVEVMVLGTSITVYTNENGEYLLTGFETDYYDVSFDHPDYRDTTVSAVFASVGENEPLDVIMGIPCPTYVAGDFNGSGSFNIADVVDAYSKLKTGLPEPYLVCECPPGSEHDLAVGMDVNNNCEFNIADIIAAYSKLKIGEPELIPCEECPPSRP